jgi:hypothetical protein
MDTQVQQPPQPQQQPNPGPAPNAANTEEITPRYYLGGR